VIPFSVIYRTNFALFLPMTQLFLDKDADTIYEELQENNIEDNQEEEYREDRMDQMISRYGY
jgi:hypothetical protein